MRLMTSLTSILPKEDPARFKMGTPAEVESTLRRCWTVAPTSDQIVSDILALPRVLEKIIEANGCVVPDEFLRSGRRERRADDEGNLAGRKRPRQRIATNTDLVLHPDCDGALALLDEGGWEALIDVEFEAADEEFDRASLSSDAFSPDDT